MGNRVEGGYKTEGDELCDQGGDKGLVRSGDRPPFRKTEGDL